MPPSDLTLDVILVVSAVGGERRDWDCDLLEQATNLRGVSTSFVVRVDATIRPVPASTPMGSLRHKRRVLPPCFPSSHSPGPYSGSPVQSTGRSMGRVLDRGFGSSSISARRLRVL